MLDIISQEHIRVIVEYLICQTIVRMIIFVATGCVDSIEKNGELLSNPKVIFTWNQWTIIGLFLSLCLSVALVLLINVIIKLNT